MSPAVRALWNSLELAALLVDEELVVRAATPAGLASAGLTPTERGPSLVSLDGRGPDPTLASDVRKVFASGTALERDLRSEEGETRLLHRRIAPHLFADGASRGVVVTYLDAHSRSDERSRLELEVNQRGREIVERADELRAIVDTAVDAIVTIDAAGTVDVFNAAAERIFGYTRDEVYGRNVSMLMPADVAAEHDGYVRRYLETRVARVIGIGREIVARRKDGSTFPAELMLGQYDHSRFAGFVRDITERKRLEAENLHAQKMEVIGRLASGVAHDFNNLLAGILGALRMVRDRVAADGEAQRMLGEVMEETQRGAALARRLLDLGSAGVSERRPIHPCDVVRRAESTVRRLIGEDVRVRVDCGGGDSTVEVDPHRLEHALLNLVINARDAMPRGGELVLGCRSLLLEPGGDQPPGDYAEISVTDDGAGMDEPTRRRATEAFFTTKAPGKGTGLGLSSVAALATECRGHLVIESEPGRGTSVRLRLPRVRVAALDAVADPRADPSAERATSRRGNGETILVVEDERLVRLGICHALEAAGYTVLSAPDPGAALRLLDENEHSIDLLLTDVVLPDLSGPELAAAFAVRSKGTRVLFMSAFPATELVAQGRIPAGTVTLEKPFDDTALAQQVASALLTRGPSH